MARFKSKIKFFADWNVLCCLLLYRHSLNSSYLHHLWETLGHIGSWKMKCKSSVQNDRRTTAVNRLNIIQWLSTAVAGAVIRAQDEEGTLRVSQLRWHRKKIQNKAKAHAHIVIHDFTTETFLVDINYTFSNYCTLQLFAAIRYVPIS